MSQIVVTVKLPKGVEADDVEVTVNPMPAKAEESAVYPTAWPFAFYDSHTAEGRLETLAKLFEQTVEDKLTGRVSIGAPEQAAADIRSLLAQVEALNKALAEADGCFNAALVEGWIDALANGDIERIQDIWNRRLSYAQAILAVPDPAESSTPARESATHLEWRPIETAPKDRVIEVFAPGRSDRWEGDLGDMVTLCRWHGDAGFCVCELREPTHWRPHNPPAPAEARSEQAEGEG